jgi:predicted PurR-regulated permease PerM
VADKITREKRLTARRVFLDPSTPSSWTVVRVVLVAFIVWNFANFFTTIFTSLASLFFLLVLSIFFAYLIDPLVKFIRRPFKERNLEKIMPRPLAIGIAYIFVFTILGVAISYLAPRVAEQARQFATNLPNYAVTIQSGITDLSSRYENYKIPENLQTEINTKIGSMVGELGTAITAFLGILALSIVSYLPWLILIPILSFFFLKDVNLFRLSFLRAFPSGRWRARAEAVLADVNTTLAAYTRAQLISCVLIGLVCTFAFYVLGLNYALLLGILAGTLEFIPLIGPLTVGIIATTVAGVSSSPGSALYVAIFLIILRVMQDYVIYPRIVREGIHLHPLVIILSVLAGEQIAGIPGVFLSIPIVAIVTVLYKHTLEHSGRKGLFAGWFEPKQNPLEEIQQ